jgi:hypothetical protein
MTTTTPLAVYDVHNDEEHQLLGTPAHERLLAWMASEKIHPTHVIRIEIHADGPHARITERDRDEHGRILVNDEGTDHRLREPFDVPIATLPPGVRRPPAAT